MNLIALKSVNVDGLNRLEMSCCEKSWIEKIKHCVEVWGQIKWRESMGNSRDMTEYRNWKDTPAIEEYASGGESAKIRMLLRGGYLPLRGNEKFEWRNRNNLCRCGQVETTDHWLFQCNLYNLKRREFENIFEIGEYTPISILKGYSTDKKLDKGGLKFLECMWNLRKQLEKDRTD